jgi:hypothetical protein
MRSRITSAAAGCVSTKGAAAAGVTDWLAAGGAWADAAPAIPNKNMKTDVNNLLTFSGIFLLNRVNFP